MYRDPKSSFQPDDPAASFPEIHRLEDETIDYRLYDRRARECRAEAHRAAWKAAGRALRRLFAGGAKENAPAAGAGASMAG